MALPTVQGMEKKDSGQGKISDFVAILTREKRKRKREGEGEVWEPTVWICSILTKCQRAQTYSCSSTANNRTFDQRCGYCYSKTRQQDARLRHGCWVFWDVRRQLCLFVVFIMEGKSLALPFRLGHTRTLYNNVRLLQYPLEALPLSSVSCLFPSSVLTPFFRIMWTSWLDLTGRREGDRDRGGGRGRTHGKVKREEAWGERLRKREAERAL